jgi:glycosyltransferase involved in cell wall biosynthesis
MTVSVIIPAYNATAYLREAIESALRQTVPAAEIFVVDDGSTDATGALAAEFGAPVTVLRQQNAGVSAARNRGARETTAEWLLFLDADDRLLPNAIDALQERAAGSRCGVVYGQTVYFDEAAGARRVHGDDRSEGVVPSGTRGSFWKSAIATPGAAIVRRDVFAAIGGFAPEFDTLADRDFWIRAGMVAEFGFARASVVEKRAHGANMSSDLARAMKQAAEVQLRLFTWSQERGYALDFLATSPAEIIDNQLRKGLRVCCLAGLRAVLGVARAHGITSLLMPAAERYLRLPPAAARLGLRVRASWQRLTGAPGK